LKAFSNGNVSTVMLVSLMLLYLSDANGAGSSSGEEVFTMLRRPGITGTPVWWLNFRHWPATAPASYPISWLCLSPELAD